MSDEIFNQRLRKLEELRARGIEPYPTTFVRTAVTGEAVCQFDELEGTDISVAGRMVSRRIMGKASFCHIADGTGRLQLFVKEDLIGAEQYQTFRDLYDLGDFVGATGRLMKTRAGEISVEVRKLTLLAKALRPLPEK